MSNINVYSLQAELAQAAYGTFSGRTIEIEELTRSGADMSTSQATAFVEKWQVAAQYGNGTGLSATVFESREDGAKYLAIRGTELSANDVVSSTLLALGWPSNFNPQFLALKSQIENVWMQDPAVLQGQNFVVTGHSLGGYLAAAIKSSFPQATQGYLFNAPGVGGILGNVADSLAYVLGLGSISTDSLWNVRSSEGVSFVAGLGYQLGIATNIQTEATNSHGISTLVDALAVQAVYAKLAPSITETQLNSVLDAFGSLNDSTSAPINKTLESALDALRFIALGPSTSKTEIGNRDALYTNLNNTTFQNKLTELAGTTQLTLLTDKNAGEILDIAKDSGAQGLAARYALVAANPFVLAGADYSAFAANGALARFDPNNGTGNITDEYLSDRANFLVRALWFNTQDKNPYSPSAGGAVPGRSIFENESHYFEDAVSGYKIQQGGLFNNTPRYYFGDNQANNPAESKVADHFYGGGGDDTFTAAEGDDYLEGGTGTDTYTVNAGDGVDTHL